MKTMLILNGILNLQTRVTNYMCALRDKDNYLEYIPCSCVHSAAAPDHHRHGVFAASMRSINNKFMVHCSRGLAA